MKKGESPMDWEAVRRSNAGAAGEMHRAGVRLLAGTDAPTVLIFPGFALHEELELLVKDGRAVSARGDSGRDPQPGGVLWPAGQPRHHRERPGGRSRAARCQPAREYQQYPADLRGGCAREAAPAGRSGRTVSTLNPPSSKVTFNVKLRSGSLSTQYKLEDEIDGNMLSINLE